MAEVRTPAAGPVPTRDHRIVRYLEALGNGFHLVENVDLVAEARRLKEALLLLPREARLEVLKELGFCQICGSAEFAKCSCMLNC